MEIEIACIFCGFYGFKAIINQGEKAMIVYCDIGKRKKLAEKIFTEIVVKCVLNDDGKIWITDVRSQE